MTIEAHAAAESLIKEIKDLKQDIAKLYYALNPTVVERESRWSFYGGPGSSEVVLPPSVFRHFAVLAMHYKQEKLSELQKKLSEL